MSTGWALGECPACPGWVLWVPQVSALDALGGRWVGALGALGECWVGSLSPLPAHPELVMPADPSSSGYPMRSQGCCVSAAAGVAPEAPSRRVPFSRPRLFLNCELPQLAMARYRRQPPRCPCEDRLPASIPQSRAEPGAAPRGCRATTGTGTQVQHLVTPRREEAEGAVFSHGRWVMCWAVGGHLWVTVRCEVSHWDTQDHAPLMVLQHEEVCKGLADRWGSGSRVSPCLCHLWVPARSFTPSQGPPAASPPLLRRPHKKARPRQLCTKPEIVLLCFLFFFFSLSLLFLNFALGLLKSL